MQNLFNVFFSNRVEFLYEKLVEKLFRKGSRPFDTRLIIVSSPAMKSYLMRRMAEDPRLQIAFGIEIAHLHQGLDGLQKELLTTQFTPSQLNLSLAIECEIKRVLAAEESFNFEEKTLWDPLLAYFATHKTPFKLAALAEELAKLFQKYSEYGPKLIERWKTTGEGGWQGELWRRIAGEHPRWATPYQLLNAPCPPEFSFKEVHLFGLSFLSHVKHQFFSYLSQKIPVHFWLLSPCQIFWGDIHSDKERIRLLRFWKKAGVKDQQLVELDKLLRDRNPLLANFGRLGKHLVEEMENAEFIDAEYEASHAVLSHPDFEEHFPEETQADISKESLTLLDAIQADMLVLRNPSSAIELNAHDRSIQVHAAPSKLREVEIVYQALLRVIHESADSIEPKDILIMAPEINDYAPFIRKVFENSFSQLPCQIMDLTLLSHGELAQNFLYLLNLSQSKWESEAILKLLSFGPFRKKWLLNEEDLSKLTRWVETFRIRWGFSKDHRNDLLIKEGFSPLLDTSSEGTWEKGLDNLLLSAIMASSENEEEMLELETPLFHRSLELASSELLGRFIQLLQQIKEDLKPLSENNEKELSEWALYFTLLFETYFASDALNPDEVRDIKKALDQLQRASLEIKGKFSALSLLERLKSILKTKESCVQSKNFQAVQFASLLPTRSIPAKIVVLMGLNEESFPRKESFSSLNALSTEKESDFCPAQIDYDRTLFLEALLSARNTFLISYVAKNSPDGKRSPPSMLVNELLEYIDKSYRLNGENPSKLLFTLHPFHSFDRAYFENTGSVKSYSQRDYKAALGFYGKKDSPFAFVKEFQLGEIKSRQMESVIELQSLKKLTRNPLKFYLNKRLSIYLEEKEIRHDFELSSLDQYALKMKGIKFGLDKTLTQAETEGSLPQAPFNAYAKGQVREELDNFYEAFAHFDLKREELCEVEFTHAVNSATYLKNRVLLPPVTYEAQHGTIEIIGKLPLVTSKGLICFKKADLPNLIINYPHILFLNALPEYFERQVIFLKEKAPLKIDIDFQQSLSEFMEYYFLAQNTPSPLMPEWIKAILDGDIEALRECIKEAFEEGWGFSDPYLKWCLTAEILDDAESLMTLWGPMCRKLYGSLYAGKCAANEL